MGLRPKTVSPRLMIEKEGSLTVSVLGGYRQTYVITGVSNVVEAIIQVEAQFHPTAVGTRGLPVYQPPYQLDNDANTGANGLGTGYGYPVDPQFQGNPNAFPPQLPNSRLKLNQHMTLSDYTVREIKTAHYNQLQGGQVQDEHSAVYEVEAVWTWRATCPIVTYDFGSDRETVTWTPSYRTYHIDDVYDADGNRTEDHTFDNMGAVNIGSDKEAKGTPRIRPKGSFNLVWHPPGTFEMTAEYKNTVLAMVGHVNWEKFYGWDTLEVLFTGMSGKLIDQRNQLWELVFTFEVDKNRAFDDPQDESQKIAGIFVQYLNAWEYVWFDWKKQETEQADGDKKEVVIRAVQADVNVIYEPRWFYPLFTQERKDAGMNGPEQSEANTIDNTYTCPGSNAMSPNPPLPAPIPVYPPTGKPENPTSVPVYTPPT